MGTIDPDNYLEYILRWNKTHLEDKFNMRSKAKVGKFKTAWGKTNLFLIINISHKIPPVGQIILI